MKNLVFLKTFSWSAAGAAVSFLFIPLLALYFSPKEFGVLALVMTISNTAVPLISCRYEQALLRIKDHKQYITAVWSTLLCILTASTLFSILTIIVIKYELFLNYELLTYALIMSFSLSLYNMLDRHFTASNMVEMVGRQFFIRNLMVSLFPLVAVFFDLPGESALVIYSLLGVLCTVLISLGILFLNSKWHFNFSRVPQKKEILSFYRRYFDLFKFNMPHAFLSNLIVLVPQFFVTIKFGLALGGIFSIANRALYGPAAIINHASVAVNSVILREDIANSNKNKLLIKKILQRSSGITIVVLTLILVIYNKVGTLYDGDWADLPATLIAMCPFLFITLLCGPLATVPIFYQEERTALFFEIFSAVLKLIGMYLGSSYGFIWCVFGFSLAAFLGGGAFFFWCWGLMITNARNM